MNPQPQISRFPIVVQKYVELYPSYIPSPYYTRWILLLMMMKSRFDVYKKLQIFKKRVYGSLRYKTNRVDYYITVKGVNIHLVLVLCYIHYITIGISLVYSSQEKIAVTDAVQAPVLWLLTQGMDCFFFTLRLKPHCRVAGEWTHE